MVAVGPGVTRNRRDIAADAVDITGDAVTIATDAGEIPRDCASIPNALRTLRGMPRLLRWTRWALRRTSGPVASDGLAIVQAAPTDASNAPSTTGTIRPLCRPPRHDEAGAQRAHSPYNFRGQRYACRSCGADVGVGENQSAG